MRWILMIVILPLVSSCWMVRHKNFTLPLNGYVKNNSIKMNGYYKYYDSVENRFEVFILYSNGVIYYENMGGIKKEEIDDYIRNIILVHQKILYENKNPGSFRINDNKIAINVIIPTHYNMHAVNEFQGTIISDSSFMITYDYWPQTPIQTDTLIYHFFPYPKPDSTKNWLLHRKWYRGK